MWSNKNIVALKIYADKAYHLNPPFDVLHLKNCILVSVVAFSSVTIIDIKYIINIIIDSCINQNLNCISNISTNEKSFLNIKHGQHLL
jgi:hypothetical protein